MYALIGRLTVWAVVRFIRKRVDPRTVAIVGGGVLAAITAVSVVGYLAARDVPEA
jgi:hypothetical protein